MRTSRHPHARPLGSSIMVKLRFACESRLRLQMLGDCRWSQRWVRLPAATAASALLAPWSPRARGLTRDRIISLISLRRHEAARHSLHQLLTTASQLEKMRSSAPTHALNPAVIASDVLSSTGARARRACIRRDLYRVRFLTASPERDRLRGMGRCGTPAASGVHSDASTTGE